MPVKPLSPHPEITAAPGPLVLVVVDGVGIGRGDDFDALHLARTPTLDRLFGEGLYTTLRAHGTAVGLPTDSDLGGSEVGHNVMGAGRVVDQGPKLVDSAFASGSVFDGPWKDIATALVEAGRTLHLVGLLSDGNIHAHVDHLYQLIDRAAADGIRRLRVHALFDGRDVPDRSAGRYLETLETVLERHRQAGLDYAVGSGGGRMISVMDRYNADWSIVERGYHAIVHGRATLVSSAIDEVARLQAADDELSDQYIPPFVVAEADGRAGTVVDGDAVILANFRGDRAVELCAAFDQGDDFAGFDRGRRPKVTFAGMMLYDGDLGIPNNYLVTPMRTEGCLSEYLAASGVGQFACAETQKFGHVTYFWNGNRSGMFDPALEAYVEIPSDRVPFEQRPWMKAAETADALLEAIDGGRFTFLRANFAGGDMVGHSGRLEATIIALEAIDLSLARVEAAVRRARGCLVVTADHGNAEDMVERDKAGRPLYDDEGRPRRRTAHSLNPVPFVIAEYGGRALERVEVEGAGLGNIAPTLAALLGFARPEDYADSLVAASPR